MTIDEAAQKIADAIAEAQAAGYDIDWDRSDGGVWLTRNGDGHRGFESRHVREQYDGSWAVSE